jgi:DedD protein
MKLIIDERVKHRLIGLAVILSIGVILAPTVMRQSNQHLYSSFTVTMKIPPKPPLPDIASIDKKELFKTIKTTNINIPLVSAQNQTASLIKADSIPASKAPQVVVAAPEIKLKPVLVAVNKPAAKAVKQNRTSIIVKKVTPKPLTQKTLVKAPAISYAVQLASFNQMTKAQILVNKLRAKGFKGNIIQISAPEGIVYKVHVGKSLNKEQVDKLKKQLASSMRLNGFIVTT